MKRYRRVWVVYCKELTETLRDRRTLIAMIAVPVVLYPVLMVVLLQALKSETARRQTTQYSICVPTEGHRTWLQSVLRQEDADRAAMMEEYERAAERQGDSGDSAGGGLLAYLRADMVTIDVVGPNVSMWDLVVEQKYSAGILIEPPPDAGDPAELTNRIIQVIYCDTEPRSEFVFDRLDRILAYEAERIVRARVVGLAGDENLLTPLMLNGLSTASSQKQFARILALIVPFLLVTMTVTGATYPAIDLTAGERERGTLETLAVSPVPVGQIVAGKFSVIVTVAMLSTLLNLGSMTAMVHFSKLDRLASSMQPARQVESLAVEAKIDATEPVDASKGQTQHGYLQRRRQLEQQAALKVGFLTTAAPIVLLAMVPLAVLFGGIMLAVCSFARTFKEAQNYMMPVVLAATVPAAVVSYMPTVKLEGVMAVIPVANIVILMRELFLGNYDVPAMTLCLLSTCFYAVTAVAMAAKLYGHEAVLFSDVGSYKTLVWRRFLKPKPAPSAAFALLTVAVLFPLNFYWQSYMLEADSSAERFRAVVAAAQVLVFAAPAVFLCWYMKLDVRRTFSLRAPGGRPLLGTGLLALSIVPVASLLGRIQSTLFPSASPSSELVGQLEHWFTSGSLAGVLVVFAVLPAICEELFFRGFLLAGLRQKLSTLPLILVVGLIFGLHHVSSEKILIVGSMGVLFTLVCLKTRSIYPAMLLHMAHNGLALASTRIEGLRLFLGLPGSEVELAAIDLNGRAIAFIGVFLIGLVLVGGTRERQREQLYGAV